jgi:dTMP kinase
MFITFEGIDCSGKSTQVTLLKEGLERQGYEVVVVREPGGTRISERVRDILLSNDHAEMNATSEFLLFSAARAQLVSEVIRPALQRNAVVLCDRFDDSSIAYQGWGRGIALAHIEAINTIATFSLKPDVTFLIDISPTESVRRKQLMQGSSEDRMERSGLAFYERVREGYLHIAKAEPQRFIVIDGTKAVHNIAEEIWNIVTSRMKR